MNVYFVYKVLTNRIRALIIAAGYISPGSLSEFRTACKRRTRAGPGNEAITAPALPSCSTQKISPQNCGVDERTEMVLAVSTAILFAL